MFKNTENSTVVVQRFNISTIERGMQLANLCNVSRLIVYCINEEECSLLNNMISEYEKVSVWCKIDKNNIDKEVPEYENIGVIVCTDQKRGIDYKIGNAFWEIHLEIGELPKDYYLDCENIIWHIDFLRTEWALFDAQLNVLLDGYKTNELMIENILLPLDLIREHPCNVYLCDGKHCHSEHGKVPRNIYIDTNGNMYPYGIVKEELKMGNIFFDLNIMEEYKQSESIANFIRLNRNLYLQILDKCNYDVIPWFDMLGEI